MEAMDEVRTPIMSYSFGDEEKASPSARLLAVIGISPQ